MIVQAPNQIPINSKWNYIFLAGTIDNGESEDWQDTVGKALDNWDRVILNPRRTLWNPNLEQRFENPEFSQQVNWELNGINKSDVVIFNFLPESKSPITLLELGLRAPEGMCYVCCPDEFWRSGNVNIVAQRFNIPIFKDITQLIQRVNEIL